MPRYILVTCTDDEAARIADVDWYPSADVTDAIDGMVGRSYIQEDGLDALHAFLDAAKIGYETSP